MSTTLRPVLAVLIPATLGLTASTAAAQSGPPGACECAVATAAPLPAPAAAPAPPRWSLGLRMGGMSLAPSSDPEAATDYAVGALTVGYRLRPRWELQLAFEHAQEQLEDGTAGDEARAGVTLAALYHLAPAARWDWYLLAGLGSSADAAEELDDEARERSQRAHVHVGGGVARRWGHLALSAELRVVGVSPAHEHDHPTDAAAMTTVPGTPPAADDEGASGALVTLGAAYTF